MHVDRTDKARRAEKNTDRGAAPGTDRDVIPGVWEMRNIIQSLEEAILI